MIFSTGMHALMTIYGMISHFPLLSDIHALECGYCENVLDLFQWNGIVFFLFMQYNCVMG